MQLQLKGECTMKNLENYIAKCEENAKPDSEIDLTDFPELTKEDFARGHFKYWKPMKKPITFRIDIDNLSWLKSFGKGYQAKLNEVIRWAKENHCPIDSF